MGRSPIAATAGLRPRLLAPRLAALALAAALPALSCAPSPAPGDGAGRLVIADTSEPDELNCLRTNDSIAVSLCRLISGTLLDHGKDLEIVPRLAGSYTISGDGTILTFKLREDVRWHDGRPFTARDVLYTVRRIRDPGAAIRGGLPALFETLERIEAPDDHTVVATYREPFAPALQAWTRAFMMPAHLPFAAGEETPLGRAPVGTGPFRFVRWEPGSRIVLEANEDFHGGRPGLDRLIYRVIPDRRSILVGLKTGELDIAGLDPVEAASLGDQPLPFQILRYPSRRLELILWNTRPEPGLFQDPRVRRALSMAFDRRAYVEKVLEGHAAEAVSTFIPSAWAHDPALGPLPHDPDAAARLLAEAGWKDRDGDGVLDTPHGPARFTLIYYSGLPNEESIATLFKEAVAPLGVEVELRGMDWPTQKEAVRGGAFQASVYVWTVDVDPDPFDFFHSSQGDGGLNYGGYSNPEVDRLSEEGRRVLDPARRAEIYHRVERILREEQPFTFISHPSMTVAVSRRVKGVETGASGFWGWYPAPLRWRTGPR